MPPFSYVIKLLVQKCKFLVRGGKLPAIPPDLKSEPVILLISETNVPRIERMLYYLQKTDPNQKFIYIGSKAKFRPEFFQRCKDIYSITVDHPWQVEKLIAGFSNVKLIHTFESRSLYAWHAIQSAGKKIPVIFDFQDLYTNYTGDKNLAGWMRENLWFEAQCLKKSDALISYSLEWIPARKSLEIPKKKVVYFPFYLDDEEIIPPGKNQKRGDIHVVYAGGIAAIDRNISFNMTLTEKSLRHTNIFLHVYPSPLSGDAVIQSYFEYAKTHPNLIMHAPVNNNEMAKELNQYDFGIVPFFKTLEYQSESKYRYSSALKIFNYFEAGLPVVIAEDVEYQSWLIRHYNAGIVLKNGNIDELPLILQQTDLTGYKVSIGQLQQNLRLSEHISKIRKLYKDLTEKK